MKKFYHKLYNYAIKQDCFLNKEEYIVFMLSDNGAIYSCILPRISDTNAILLKFKDIIREDDRTITALICYLTPSGLDIPSFNFCKALLQLNQQNRKALIYMHGENGIICKELLQAMPHVFESS